MSGSQLPACIRAELAAARGARPRITHQPPVSWRDTREGPRVKIASLVSEDSHALAQVLGRRRSQRAWAPPTLASLATLLVRCLRVADWTVAPDGYLATHRPVPSAGGRHPIEIHVLAREVEDLEQGCWRFDALTCELVESETPCEPALRELGEVVGANPPPAALVAIAHLNRTLSRYPTGLSLLWRDAGALLATLQLCATDTGLASCITGTCGILIDDLDAQEVDVGALLVGADAAV